MSDSYRSNWNPLSYYKDDEVASSYNQIRFTSLSGRIFNFLEKRLIQKAFADVPAGSLVGDAPCGTGRLAEVLLKNGFHVVGIDISAQMLSQAQGQLLWYGNRFRTLVSDIRALPDGELRLDAALCARVLMHFPLDEQIELLRSLASITKGRLVFTQGLDTPYQRFRRFVKRLLRNQPPADYPVTPQALKKLIADAGLREVRRYSLLPGISEAIVVVTEPRAAPL